MGLMGPHPNAVALLVDPVADVVGEELVCGWRPRCRRWCVANCAGAGVRNLRRRRLRLGNRSYLQQLIEQKSGRWVEAPKEGVCVVTLSVVPEVWRPPVRRWRR